MTATIDIDLSEPDPAAIAGTPEIAGTILLQTIAAHIESATRFGAGDLVQQEPETHQLAHVAATLTQTPHLSLEFWEGNGALQPGITAVGDRRTLEEQLAARIERARADVPAALRQWVDAAPATYRRLLPGGAALLHGHGVLGHQHACPSCDGERVVGCSRCHRSGVVACRRCNGSRVRTCGRCLGLFLNAPCDGCNGTRGFPASEFVNGAYREVWHNCTLCRGSGRQLCKLCDRGNVWCEWCSGEGEETCGGCGGRKTLACGTCDAQGIRHVCGAIRSTVHAGEMSVEISLEREDAQARNLLLRLAPERLIDFGELRDVRYRVEGSALQTLHRLEVPVRRARVQAAGESFEVHGFGAQVEVLDFRGIATRLLEVDLLALQAVTDDRRLFPRSDAVLPVLSDFVRSEVNMALAEAASKDAGDDGAEQAIAGNQRGLVTASYVRAARRALNAAVAQAYRGQVARPAVALVASSAGAAAVMSWLGWPSAGWLAPAAVAAACGAVGWGATELLADHRIRSAFPESMGDRVVAQAHEIGSFGNWRLLAVGGIVAGALAGASAVQEIMRRLG